MHKPMRVRKNAEIRKPEILRSFYQTIIEEGIEGASLGKVARRMDIHPSLIMHYFSTKENMLIELVDYIVSEYGSLLRNIRVHHSEPHERIHQLLDVLWSDEWYRMTDISADFSVLSVSFRNGEVNQRFRHLYSVFRKFLSHELQRFADAGIITADDPEVAADVVISMIEGYRHFKHFYVDEDASGKFRQEMKRSVLKLLDYRQDHGRAG
jgi:AcrR family transcriptional regulator